MVNNIPAILIEYNGKVSFEAPSINGVHVVSGALVHARVHLSGRIDFNLGLDLVLIDAPLAGLKKTNLSKLMIFKYPFSPLTVMYA